MGKKKESVKKPRYQLKDDWSLTEMIVGGRQPGKRQRIEEFKRNHPGVQEIKLNFNNSAVEADLKSEYLSMKGVPTRNLKLRHSMAKYLLRLVDEDRRRMSHFWYADCLEVIMSDYLGNELKRIMQRLEGK